MPIAEDESIDLAELSAVLRQRCAPERLVGYLQGKTEMRDVLVQAYGHSELETEDWVDTLETRGFIRFEGDPSSVDRDEGVWHLTGPVEPPTVVIEPGDEEE